MYKLPLLTWVSGSKRLRIPPVNPRIPNTVNWMPGINYYKGICFLQDNSWGILQWSEETKWLKSTTEGRHSLSFEPSCQFGFKSNSLPKHVKYC